MTKPKCPAWSRRSAWPLPRQPPEGRLPAGTATTWCPRSPRMHHFVTASNCNLLRPAIYWQDASMLEMRPDCERCGMDLPAQDAGAFICSMECTYCADCTEDLDERCANCGGELL